MSPMCKPSAVLLPVPAAYPRAIPPKRLDDEAAIPEARVKASPSPRAANTPSSASPLVVVEAISGEMPEIPPSAVPIRDGPSSWWSEGPSKQPAVQNGNAARSELGAQSFAVEDGVVEPAPENVQAFFEWLESPQWTEVTLASKQRRVSSPGGSSPVPLPERLLQYRAGLKPIAADEEPFGEQTETEGPLSDQHIEVKSSASKSSGSTSSPRSTGDASAALVPSVTPRLIGSRGSALLGSPRSGPPDDAATNAAIATPLAVAAVYEATTNLGHTHSGCSPRAAALGDPLLRRLSPVSPRCASQRKVQVPRRFLGFANATALSEAQNGAKTGSFVLGPQTSESDAIQVPDLAIGLEIGQQLLFLDGDVADEFQKGYCGFSVSLQKTVARMSTIAGTGGAGLATPRQVIGGDGLGMCHHYTWDGLHCVTAGLGSEHANRCAGRLCSARETDVETQICRVGVVTTCHRCKNSNPNVTEVVCGPPTPPPGACREDTCPFLAEGSCCPYGGSKKIAQAVFRL